MMGFLPSVGSTEILILIGVVILLFGLRRVPEIARSIGQTIGELRRATDRDAGAGGSEAE
jgi:TatA/E family protein of Tat protein translocase